MMPTKVEIGSPQQDTHDSQRFTNHTRKGTQGMKDSEDSLDMPSSHTITISCYTFSCYFVVYSQGLL